MLEVSSTYVDAMFAFAERRHRHALGENVNDEILRRHSFTNIYCELDESTQVIRHAVNNGHYPKGVLGALLKVLFNNAYTLRIFCQYPLSVKEFIETGDYTNLLKIMQLTYCTSSSEYLIKQPTGYSKLEGLLLIARHFRENAAWKQTEDVLFLEDEGCNYYTYKTIANWLCGFKWIGPFLANEITYELSQQIPKPFRDINSYALCGTSTLRGIARLMGAYDKVRPKATFPSRGGSVDVKQLDQSQALEVCCYLLTLAPKDFRLREVTRTLGEFDRYERYRLGQKLYDIGDRIPDVIDNVNRPVFAPLE